MVDFNKIQDNTKVLVNYIGGWNRQFKAFIRKVFSREMLQKQWASVDYRRNMSIIGLRQIGRSKQIAAIGSYAEYEKDTAEVAFLVKEELHGLGIGTYLLEGIARENGYKGFVATVLVDVMKKTDEWKKYALRIKANNAKRPAFQDEFASILPDWKSL